jgi:LuxR family maltose regulon positive regulatory protein
LAALQSSQVNVEPVLTTLLNEIADFPDNVVLILDDYRVIESQPIGKAPTFLLDHLPPRMHLVIATRTDPTLTLSRLRAGCLWPSDYCLPQICRHVAGHSRNDGSTLWRVSG